MSDTLTASLAERIDDATLQHVRNDVIDAQSGKNDHIPESTASLPQSRITRFLEEAVAKRIGHRQFVKLVANRGQIASAWRELPDRMHLVANQTKLMMELVDDFRTGTYRKVPWRSLAVAAGAILYAANPADVIPDVIVGFGLLDDIAVAAIASRVIRKDLEAYCEFKGYTLGDYFPNA